MNTKDIDSALNILIDTNKTLSYIKGPIEMGNAWCEAFLSWAATGQKKYLEKANRLNKLLLEYPSWEQYEKTH